MRSPFNFRRCSAIVWSRCHIRSVLVSVLLISSVAGFVTPVSGKAISMEQSAPISSESYGGCSGIYHTVQPGETIYSIAARYGTTAYRIAVCNGRYSYRVYVGSTVLIPSSSPYRRGQVDELAWPMNSVVRKFAGEGNKS